MFQKGRYILSAFFFSNLNLFYMIKGYHQMKMRQSLESRFQEYKNDWEYKDQIDEGSFIPQIEIDEIETRLLCEMSEHAIKLNIFQSEKLKEINSLKTLLVEKLSRFQAEELEKRETLLESESQLETIIFVLLASRTEIIKTQRNKGQVSLF